MSVVDIEDEEDEPDLEPEEESDVVEGARLGAHLVYEIVRRDGVRELERPMASLVWSGLAAGIVISFSVVAEALIRIHLPDTSWRPLVENFGYSVGFLMVILGRLQLFTENTLTTVIPFCHHPSARKFAAILRLWSIVFAANVAGTVVAAVFIVYTSAFTPEALGAIGDISRHMMDNSPLEMFARAIPAGILIASVVWMLPSAGGNAFSIIVLFTYFIALGDFTHVVAGSTEAAFLILTGDIDIGTALGRFLGPVFAGNVIGGTVVVALLAYAQVHHEIAITRVQNGKR